MLLSIIHKELKRVFSDKRLVISTFVVPALSIYILYSLMGSMVGNKIGDIKSHEALVYVSNAPSSFTSYYDSVKADYNMNISFGNYDKAEFSDDIRAGKVDLLVQFEDDFDAKLANYTANKSPEIMTFSNPAEEYSAEAKSKFVYEMLEGYKKVILTNRFGNINYVNAFDVDLTNENFAIVDEKKAAASGLGMIIPMLLAIILFAGAMGIGMDTIAGEKERGTMATLLLTPVSRETIALGKVIGLGVVAIISAACSLGAIIASLPNMMSSFEEGNTIAPMGLSFSLLQYGQLFVIMITLVGIYVGLICLISVRARSVKEAGTYMAPVYMIIMVAAFSNMFSKGGDVALYKFAIPVYGSINAIKELFAFELSLTEFAVTVCVSFVVTALIIKLITKTFNDEKVMFNA